MAERILVFSAAVGAGHLRAAQAVELALKELAPQAIVRNVDILSLTNAVFRRVYGKAYLDLVNHAPHVLGYFYDFLDQKKGNTKGDKLLYQLQKVNLKQVIKLLTDEPWDVVVNTHFLPAQILAEMKKSGTIAIPQITVTTDFETHRLWMHQPCERFTTATEEGAAYLAHFGALREHIQVTGIPIHPVFAQEKDRTALLKTYGLDAERPVVLQLAGGFGVGPIEKLFNGILSIPTPLQVIMVAGKNAKVQKEIEGIKPPARHKVKVFGFTDKIDELMCIADVVVSKPGGLTSSETLARGAALAIVNPIPGQESRNSDYLLEMGAAIKINNIATLPYKLGKLLGDRKQLELLKRNARNIGKPRAAFDVAKLALEFAGKRH